MKLITRDTDYAIRALYFIAGSQDKIVPVTSLVKKLRIPRPFLRKILQILHKKGILKASKGYGGGFRLALSTNKIYLIDLIEIFQGSLKINECLFKKKICPNIKTCRIKRELDTIEQYIVKKLRTITIASLLKKDGG